MYRFVDVICSILQFRRAATRAARRAGSEDVGRGPGPTQETGLVAAVLGAPRKQGSTRAPTKPFASGSKVALSKCSTNEVARSQRASLDASVANMASGASTISATAAMEASRLASEMRTGSMNGPGSPRHLMRRPWRGPRPRSPGSAGSPSGRLARLSVKAGAIARRRRPPSAQ